MARVLAATVIVGGKTLPAGTEETAELRKAITNPAAWEGESELPAEQPPAPVEPPRAGAGATTDAWQEYARQLGIEVPDAAGRDDIVALVDARNVSN